MWRCDVTDFGEGRGGGGRRREACRAPGAHSVRAFLLAAWGDAVFSRLDDHQRGRASERQHGARGGEEPRRVGWAKERTGRSQR